MRALFIVVVLAHFAGLSNPFRIHFGRPSFVHFGYIRSSNLFAKDNKAIDGIFESSLHRVLFQEYEYRKKLGNALYIQKKTLFIETNHQYR